MQMTEKQEVIVILDFMNYLPLPENSMQPLSFMLVLMYAFYYCCMFLYVF